MATKVLSSETIWNYSKPVTGTSLRNTSADEKVSASSTVISHICRIMLDLLALEKPNV